MIPIDALLASDSAIIPVEAAYLPVKGLQQLIKTIGRVCRKLNCRLTIDGILLTKLDLRTNFSRDIRDSVYDIYGQKLHVFRNYIPFSVRAAEATAEGVSGYQYDLCGKVAKAFEAVTDEVLALSGQVVLEDDSVSGLLLNPWTQGLPMPKKWSRVILNAINS